MKILFIITIFFMLQSCKAKNFKLEVDKAFKTNDAAKIENILGEYYQVNGTDALLEISYIKLALLKKDFKRVFELYQNTKYMEIKKNPEIQKSISKFIIESNQKLKTQKRLAYYENALEVFPYAEEIYNEYLKTLLKLNKVDKAFKIYLKYDEIFNKTNKYLREIILAQLKIRYLKRYNIKILKLISKVDTSPLFLESEIIKNPKILRNLTSLPKNFNTQILKKIVPNKNFSLSKAATRLFISIGKEEEVKPYIKNIYKKSTISMKVFIYHHYNNRFNEKIDEKLMKSLLNSKNDFEQELANEILENNKNIIKNNENLINNPSEILKNSKSSESLKAKALDLMIKSKKDISFFKEYNNYIYYLIFLKNIDALNTETIKKISLTAYKSWKNSRMLVKYLEKLNQEDINKFFNQKVVKELKDQYHIKLIYYSVILQKTDSKNEEFEKFILEKRFSKIKYLNLFKFTKKQINILIKLYIVENRFNMKNKILEKLVDILNK